MALSARKIDHAAGVTTRHRPSGLRLLFKLKLNGMGRTYFCSQTYDVGYYRHPTAGSQVEKKTDRTIAALLCFRRSA